MSEEIEMEGFKITKITTSQEESIQAKQFEGNKYFTGMEVSFGSGLDITNVKNITKVIQAAALANSLCTANNRRNQFRDGLAPRIGSSAAGYLEANSSLEGNPMYKAENIIDPKNIGKFSMDLVKKLKEAMGAAQAIEKIDVKGDVDTEVKLQKNEETSESQQDVPATPPPAPKRRANPNRTASNTATTGQEVVN